MVSMVKSLLKNCFLLGVPEESNINIWGNGSLARLLKAGVHSTFSHHTCRFSIVRGTPLCLRT